MNNTPITPNDFTGSDAERINQAAREAAESRTPLGDTYGIIARNLISHSKYPVLVGGSLAESIISDILAFDTEEDPVFCEPGQEYLRNVSVTNAVSH